jgi:hypothetical protein
MVNDAFLKHVKYIQKFKSAICNDNCLNLFKDLNEVTDIDIEISYQYHE